MRARACTHTPTHTHTYTEEQGLTRWGFKACIKCYIIISIESLAVNTESLNHQV
jgi:hypothetical protein